MNLGEKVTHDGAGIVTGDDTGRIVAKFSHEAEAESFCEAVNMLAPTYNGIPELDDICEQYNAGKLNISQLVCTIWNKALAA